MQSPSGTPFADIIQSLAGLHQEQHQHMLAIKEEQDKRFEVLLRAQHEDREMFRSWVDREVRAIPSSKDSTSPLPLNKMGPQDDPEAFLDLFEKSAEARGWPPGDWPMRLIPLLSGEAQVAAHQLPVQNLLVYRDLKRAILQRVGRTPEQHRQRFRTLTLEESGRPFVMAQQLRDSCRKWLMADSSDVEDVIDRVVLEQFVAKLPRKTAQWVQCHRPTSLNQAIQLAEDQMVACPGVGDPLPSATLSLSFSPPPLSLSKPVPLPRSRGGLPPKPAPRWRTGYAADPAAAPRAPPRGGSSPTGPFPPPLPSPLSPRQLLDPLPAARAAVKSGPACWRCGDPGHFIDRCPLMEVGTLIRVPDAPQAALDQAGLYQIPVSIKGGTYQALVDSGCNQSSIHQSLIHPRALDNSRMVKVRCVHGEVVNYPILPVDIQFRGEKHRLEVAVNPHLRHPLILGTNWPLFNKLLGYLCADASWGKREKAGVAVAQLGEAEPEPPEPVSREQSALERNILPERDDFPLEQSRDETLKNAFDQVRSIDGQLLHPDQPLSYPYFSILKDKLYRVTQDAQTKQDTTQLLIPRSRREMLFQAAHCNPMAGHLGQTATLNRLMARFFWPGIHENVRRWCASCRECQLVNPPATPKAPLCPLPLMQVPFERIGMDLIGPLERSARGHRFALVLVDYATRYPEAVPLRTISAKSVASALFQLISRVGIPKEILTDQGTAFMSRTIRELYELLGIKSIRTSVYHPQTDGLVERFNRTLKSMIRKFVQEDAKNWDKWLEPLLFAVREVPQASTGFSPFELLYGRQPRGVLDVLRETWEDGPSDSKNEIQYVMDLRTKLHTLGRLSMENLLQAQDKQSRSYNRGARLRQFTPGEKVLVLLPTSSSKLLAKWQGPFEVTRRVGDLNYEVARTDRGGAHQIYHLNLLKKWSEAESVMLATVVSGEEDLGPEVSSKSQSLALAPGGDHLSPSQLTDIKSIQAEFADVFSPLPGRTNLIQHHVETEPGVVVRSRPYRLPEHKKKVVQGELEAMLEMGVIEESNSDWASPIVLVPKTDGSVRFCVDYRKVNAVSKFDAYPMPRVDELLDRLGTARFYSTLDLTKGYWQIPLSPMTKEKTAFTTPFGLHQFVTLPFGLFGAPATFQRLMDKILRPHAAYAAAYLDDIIIYSGDWQRHMQHLRAVLKTLRRAGLTANPRKCAIGRVEVRYLGFHLGHGQVRPQIDKTAAVATCPRPKTKKEVRQFLGLAGYYRRFVPNFSDTASSLTDLTKKEAPDRVQWTEQCQQAFTQIKAALCGGPLLNAPNFSLPFILQTDASDRGLGAVLSQEVEGEERPVLYISRKLSKRETMYSTIEKECLAIRWAVLTLRYYLLGREFTLCSDHAPLQWLHRMKDTNARITRWYLALQPFKFQVIHRPGVQMTVADFLSRRRGGEAAGRMAPRPESGGGGMWRGGRGFAESVTGERRGSRARRKWVKCK
uniref:Gypsy retrotransposon integrase-like protein 1 n=1 Tax=Cyprinus carpio TaxID=7962 RepID=A0A8C1LM62_CYPCA